MRAHTLIFVRACAHVHTRTRTHAETRKLACMHVQIHAHAHIYTSTHIYLHTQANLSVRTRAPSHAHTATHTLSHLLTHNFSPPTPLPSPLSFPSPPRTPIPYQVAKLFIDEELRVVSDQIRVVVVESSHEIRLVTHTHVHTPVSCMIRLVPQLVLFMMRLVTQSVCKYEL